MKDSALRLQNKTILIAGPFNGITQALMRSLTEFGSDVALVTDQAPNAGRYAEGINEAREVHSEYGRAAFFPLPLNTPEQIGEALGRMAESFGRMDALIDASALSWDQNTTAEKALLATRYLAEQCLPFMHAKQRGRVIYVFEDESLSSLNLPGLTAELRGSLIKHVHTLARQLLSKNITVNGLALGVTEDFILRHFAKAGSIRKSLEELQKTHPELRLVESTEAGLGASYLASSLSVSLTGQILRLTRGFHLQET